MSANLVFMPLISTKRERILLENIDPQLKFPICHFLLNCHQADDAMRNKWFVWYATSVSSSNSAWNAKTQNIYLNADSDKHVSKIIKRWYLMSFDN